MASSNRWVVVLILEEFEMSKFSNIPRAESAMMPEEGAGQDVMV
jgi:hypothetical protein